jgi:hypothetical protein
MTTQHVNGYCPHCNEPATLEAHEIDQCNECGRYYHSNDLVRRRLLIAAAPDLLHALKWAAEYVSLYTGDGAGWTGVQQGHDRERFIDDATGNFDVEGLRAFLSETINKAEEG